MLAAVMLFLAKKDTTRVELSAVAGGNGGFIIKGAAADDSSGWIKSQEILTMMG